MTATHKHLPSSRAVRGRPSDTPAQGALRHRFPALWRMTVSALWSRRELCLCVDDFLSGFLLVFQIRREGPSGLLPVQLDLDQRG